MKILAFVDLHSNKKAFEIIKNKAKQVDLIICAGDLTQFEANMVYYLQELNKLKIPVLMIHGNHEIRENMGKACEKFDNIIFLDRASIELENTLFIGYGGGGFSRTDSEFEGFAKKIKKQLKTDKKIVLITHAPPSSTNLDKIALDHVGSKSIKKFIDKNNISLCICGHIHECAQKEDNINNCLAINPGPTGAIVTLN